MPDYRPSRVLALQDLLGRGAEMGAENARAKMQRDAALQELVTGRQMDLQNKLQEQQQEEGLKRDTAQKNFDMANQYVEDNAQHGRRVSASVGEGNASITQNEPDVFARIAGQQSIETKRLQDAAKSQVKPYADQLESLSLAHQLLDNPSSFSDKKLQVMQARFVEGPGQRLLDSVVQSMGGGKSTLEGDVAGKLNFIKSQANSAQSVDQRNKGREALFLYQDQLEPELQQAQQKFGVYSQGLAPQLQPDYRQQIANTEFQLPNQRLQELKQRKQQYLQQAGQNTTLGQPQPAQYQQPQSTGSTLWNMIKGSPISSAGQPPQAPGQQQPGQAQAGSPDPMAAIKQRVAQELSKRSQTPPQGQ